MPELKQSTSLPLWDHALEQQPEWWKNNFSGPPFRLKQLQQWVYQKGVMDPKLMSNLPLDLQKQLEDPMKPLLQYDTSLKASDHSADKHLFKCRDGAHLESVLLRSGTRRTICLSTQVGCALACKFCHTGLAGFSRNLSPGEIVEQVLHIKREEPDRISNIVVMGMGEPMLNYDQLMIALRQINSPDGLGLGARHITISTSGVKGGILKLAEEPEQWGLAVSLHAPNDELRSELMPINKSLPLQDLMLEIDTYVKMTKRRVSFEYIMLGDTNSSEKEAKELLKLLRGKLCHVNLIPYNPVPTLPYSATSLKKIKKFQDILVNGKIPCTTRFEKGQDILAACGQLAHKKVASKTCSS